MGKATSECECTWACECVERPNGCWIYHARTDSWSRTSETKHIDGHIWPQDYSDDWGLVMSQGNHLEFTKDGVDFDHKSFEGKLLCVDVDRYLKDYSLQLKIFKFYIVYRVRP